MPFLSLLCMATVRRGGSFFVGAAPPEVADALYNVFVQRQKKRNIPVQKGVPGAYEC